MPRPTLFGHRKFRRLANILQEPKPHVLGYLEFIWASCYESGNPYLGDVEDVELAAMYPGKPGTLAAALAAVRLIDEVRPGEYAVHDLFDHAPDYVRKRMEREAQRKHRYTPRGKQTGAEWRTEQSEQSGDVKASQFNASKPEQPANATHSSQGEKSTHDESANAGQSEARRLIQTNPELGCPPAPAPAPAPFNTPLSPLSGEREKESTASHPQTASELPLQTVRNKPCDNVELAAVAKRIVSHYQKTITPAHPPGGGVEAVLQLLLAGHDEKLIRHTVAGFATFLQRHPRERQHRPSAKKFFALDGDWAAFLDAQPEILSPPAPVNNIPVLPPKSASPLPRLSRVGDGVGSNASGNVQDATSGT